MTDSTEVKDLPQGGGEMQASGAQTQATQGEAAAAGAGNDASQPLASGSSAPAPQLADTAATGSADASQPLTNGDPAHGADAPNAATGAAPGAITAEPAPTADTSAGTSGTVANSAEPKTFEQLVEERFLKLERAIVQLPHSIRTVMAEGSHKVEVFAARVIQHLFSNI